VKLGCDETESASVLKVMKSRIGSAVRRAIEPELGHGDDVL
jgi:hypothetical protein